MARPACRRGGGDVGRSRHGVPGWDADEVSRRGGPRFRRFNRAVTNPRVLRSAGSPGASASVIRHVGRVSGRRYETPVGPFAVGDGFVVGLPYGPGADWVRNVLANGSATLVHEGHLVPVHQPEVVPTAEVVRDLPPSEQRTLRLFGVDQCLRLRTAPGG